MFAKNLRLRLFSMAGKVTSLPKWTRFTQKQNLLFTKYLENCPTVTPQLIVRSFRLNDQYCFTNLSMLRGCFSKKESFSLKIILWDSCFCFLKKSQADILWSTIGVVIQVLAVQDSAEVYLCIRTHSLLRGKKQATGILQKAFSWHILIFLIVLSLFCSTALHLHCYRCCLCHCNLFFTLWALIRGSSSLSIRWDAQLL